MDVSHLHTHFVFETRHPLFMPSKLKWELEQLVQTRGFEAAYLSLTCATTAWHVCDWFWQLNDQNGRDRIATSLGHKPYSKLGDFSRLVQEASEAVAVCRQLATAAKHLSVQHYASAQLSTSLRLGDGKDGDIEGHFVQIEYAGRTFIDRQLYKEALIFWLELYVDAELPEWHQLVDEQLRLKVT